ncbi:2-amino-4-hydroxy-6-hydroxymethyldihydropteridine diphosphokinase [Prosthecobacter fusiformis]|uniref:2-amino-4-hydroxy-6-hydroxymethyldihydropteridine pyrophosphokinase n=1 Tax=Prosthecobacter fusiformis TaxID=48464 RepID=A0A4R7S4F5_9BACT|nr:2-amino-4-hydroxy-6-hydroxymethyldihydropteridine diphosphokinase [Prosthecobacter fusiformis]TDU73300.1 2-amino-4-hydroxy-6-hydroxymethyldihydropteridine diphosphokinase [Prosthecobacter fusiformis]
MSVTTAFGIALGSNLGDRQDHLQQGVEQLLMRIPGARLTAGASLYETDPVDCAPGTQAFLNTVIELETDLLPVEIHAHLIAVESLLGRPAQREQNSPRTLDLDLLYAGEYRSIDPILTVPHPRLHLRRFVLQPLAEIRPTLQLPGLAMNITEALAALEDEPGSVRPAGAWRYQLMPTG